MPRVLKWTALAAVLFFTAAAADLGLRSRSALTEARRQELWRDNPFLKKEYYDGQLEKKLNLLKAETAADKLKPEEAEEKASLLRTERDFYQSESSAKLAFIWYRTAAEEFPSPLNPWAARAAARLPAAREAWRAELAAKGMNADPRLIR